MKLRHRWTYPEPCRMPRARKPATCQCGATMHFEERPKKPGASNVGIYGRITEDTVIVLPSGERLVNMSPIPFCTRGRP